MGHFVDGQWHPGWYASDPQGHFVRPATSFRRPLQAQALAAGDYRLYVSLACPWAHRTLVARSLLGLQQQLPVVVVDWLLDDQGWAFNPERPGCQADPLMGAHHLSQIYLQADPHFTGRVTVPVCWNSREATIQNNESREILRSLAQLAPHRYDLSPSPEVDRAIDSLYHSINNGVYRCGFANSQAAYDQACSELFEALEEWNQRLGQQPFTVGQSLSEADICLFTTLLRFDPVYVVHFKCSRRRILDYHHLWNYLKSLYQMKGVAETCDLEHIRHHYYESHRHLNPLGIVAQAPAACLDEPHDRWERFPQARFPT